MYTVSSMGICLRLRACIELCVAAGIDCKVI